MQTIVFNGNISEAGKSFDEICYPKSQQELIAKWNQKTFARKSILFANVSDKFYFPTVLPRQDRHLVWSETIPMGWNAWAKRHELTFKTLISVEPKKAVALLMQGIKGIKFTEEAAKWIVFQLEDKGEIDKERFNNEVIKFLVLDQKLVDLELASLVLGGNESQLAAKLFMALGHKKSLALANEIPSGQDAVRLFSYLDRALRTRKGPWYLFLKACRYGADTLKFDYKTACIIFTHICLLQTQKSSSKDAIDLILDLYQLCGIHYLESGIMMES
jgi:hypothetical protein